METLFGWTALPMSPLKRWLAVKDERCDLVIPVADGLSPVRAVDLYVNKQITYRRDRTDNWQTPETTLRLRQGDCEDYALLKRALLLNLGIPDDEIKFVIVLDLIARQHHAILIVDGLVLDNVNNLTIGAAHCVDYRPITACWAGQGCGFGK